MAYIAVTPEIILTLKSLGFTSCELNLLQPDEPTEARVELVPGKVQNLTIGMISLEDRDIYQYIHEPSPMAKYVIDESYLVNVTAPKLQ